MVERSDFEVTIFSLSSEIHKFPAWFPVSAAVQQQTPNLYTTRDKSSRVLEYPTVYISGKRSLLFDSIFS